MGFSGGYTHDAIHQVVEVTAQTYTITPEQSGFTFVQNHGSGCTFTLPADTTEVGFHCKIVTAVNVAAGGGKQIKITTAASDQLMLGSIASVGAAARQDVFIANGSSDYNITIDAVTDGGGPGMWFECILVGVDKWLIHGHANLTAPSGPTSTPTDPWSDS